MTAPFPSCFVALHRAPKKQEAGGNRRGAQTADSQRPRRNPQYGRRFLSRSQKPTRLSGEKQKKSAGQRGSRRELYLNPSSISQTSEKPNPLNSDGSTM